ncbi:MAG: PepSY domain-containing protein [Lachnospiraceae bacterium]|nr:PepSY domain-containing protein [Lachnospiraceae bacterium]
MNFRRTIALLSAGIMAAGVMAGTGITTMAAETISDAQAKAIALEDAGLSADQVTFDRIEMGTEQGASVYEIEFKTGSMEYDYDVAVADGEIVEESWEIRRPSASGSQIGEAEAKSIAVNDAGVSEADVTFIKTEHGDEDGIPVYEIEFEDQTTKFDYDVAKAGGNVLHASRKTKVPACVAAEQKASANTNTGKTGRDAAIEAALNHAGLTAGDVSGLQCHKDYDDGREVYEVEFHVGRYEYNYDIDVNNYSVLEWDKGYDD